MCDIGRCEFDVVLNFLCIYEIMILYDVISNNYT